MIASVRGAVGQVGLDRVVVEVGGVGLLVHTTPATAAACRRGEEAALATTLVVREESMTLFGFGTAAERDMFETVQTVSGVGPRLALAMLSVMGPDDLAGALRAGDTKALTAIPGIGAKSAQRLVLELRDKVGVAAATGAVSDAVPAATGRPGWREPVTEALVGLGWNAKQAADAVERVAAAEPGEFDVAVLLRLALRELRP
ncbi:MAG: Holliday junction branch migration protein RuvA [Dermatophilaceae bacterium]